MTASFLIPNANYSSPLDSIDIFGLYIPAKLNDGLESVPKPVNLKVDSFELFCSVANRFDWTDPPGCLLGFYVSSAALATSWISSRSTPFFCGPNKFSEARVSTFNPFYKPDFIVGLSN